MLQISAEVYDMYIKLQANVKYGRDELRPFTG